MISGLACPFCLTPTASRVEKTWDVEDGIRRSRRCNACGRTFPTTESVGVKELLVIKRNDRKEVFKPEKVMEGLKRAFTKTKVTDKYISELTDIICKNLYSLGRDEITSHEIGRMTLSVILKDLNPANQIAYLRFGSVFAYVHGIGDFEFLVEDLKRKVQALSSYSLEMFSQGSESYAMRDRG